MKKVKGFALIEVLISLFIFSLVGMAANDMIASSSKVKATIEKESESIDSHAQVFMRLNQDFLQATDRKVRDEDSNALSAFIGSAKTVTFTKNGWSNPANSQRSTLQRVTFNHSGTKLIRSHYNALDRTADTIKTSKEFNGVTSISFEYMDYSMSWKKHWNSETEGSLPVAIKVTIQINNQAPLYLVTEMPSISQMEQDQSL